MKKRELILSPKMQWWVLVIFEGIFLLLMFYGSYPIKSIFENLNADNFTVYIYILISVIPIAFAFMHLRCKLINGYRVKEMSASSYQRLQSIYQILLDLSFFVSIMVSIGDKSYTKESALFINYFVSFFVIIGLNQLILKIFYVPQDQNNDESLGQNCLIAPNILRNIVATANLTEESHIIEVGPGTGAVTEHLARTGGEVLAFESDQRLIPVLEEKLATYDNITVVNQDILEVDLKQVTETVFDGDYPLSVVINLPYYITIQILTHFIESEIDAFEMVMMMQKEMAERITAKPGTKIYGPLSIAVPYYMEVEITFIVPKTAFVPQPNIDSAILRLNRRSAPIANVNDEAFFCKLVKVAFQQRRKTLWDNLQHTFGKDKTTEKWLQEGFKGVGIDSKRRGETLSIQEFAKLSNQLKFLARRKYFWD